MKHTPATCPCGEPRCPICAGGMIHCTVCRGSEGQLLDICPGVPLSAEQHEWNYRGNLRRLNAATPGRKT